MKRNYNIVIIMALIIFVFPVFVTYVTMKLNKTDTNKEIQSGRNVEINCGKYIVTMDMEDFIPCVIMSQLPIDTPHELLKAHTVVIRTYILYKMKGDTCISSKELGLPFISYAQLKEKWFKEYKCKEVTSFKGLLVNTADIGDTDMFVKNLEYLRGIIAQTEKRVLKYNGELILPLYHNISNGNTRSGKELLGIDFCYLKSVKCGTDIKRENYVETKDFTIEEFKQRLVSKDIIAYKENKEELFQGEMDSREMLELIALNEKDESGYVKKVKIAGTTILAEQFAEALDLSSTSIELSECDKGIRVTTKGVGHGFGMSLEYAKNLAIKGDSWKDILKTFYDAKICNY